MTFHVYNFCMVIKKCISGCAIVVILTFFSGFLCFLSCNIPQARRVPMRSRLVSPVRIYSALNCDVTNLTLPALTYSSRGHCDLALGFPRTNAYVLSVLELIIAKGY